MNIERQEAEANCDQATINRLNIETKMIENELRSSKYDKKKGTLEQERARKNVSRRIKECIEKIYKNNQNLANHLKATLKTGTYCCYSPDLKNSISWHF